MAKNGASGNTPLAPFFVTFAQNKIAMSLPNNNIQPTTPTPLPNNRIGSDFRAVLTLKDNGVSVDWSTIEIDQIFMISESQGYAFAGPCTTSVDETTPTKLHIVWRGEKQLYQGIHRVVAQVSLNDSLKTFDKRAVNIVALSDSEDVAYPEDDTTVELTVTDVDTSIMASILAACQEATKNANEMTAYADGMEESRNAAEEERETAETAREEAETSRRTYETARRSQETLRKSAETSRVSAEQSRALAEDLRVEAEEHRDSNEGLRVSGETSRSQAETARANAEGTRVSQENTRKSNELTRQSNESTRQNNENERLGHETLRMSAEASRVSAEQSRVSAEAARVAAEAERVSRDANVVHKSGNEEIAGKKYFRDNATFDGSVEVRELEAGAISLQGVDIDEKYATKTELASKVGDLSSLATTDKTSIVNAVNELRNNIISTLNTAV